MGGYGSGKRNGQATVEGCQSLVLDINRVMRPIAKALRGRTPSDDAMVKAGSLRFAWTRRGEGAPWAEVAIAVAMNRDNANVDLRFDVDHFSLRTGPQFQRVYAISTLCRFGGRRWWWLCPNTGRRCAKLYLPNGGKLFLSRGPGAYRLAYASQNARAIDRSHRRLARIYRALGSEYESICDPLPSRPKGMRWKTYDRLAAEWDAALERHNGIFLARSERLLARWE